jgi:hypothetical protein
MPTCHLVPKPNGSLSVLSSEWFENPQKLKSSGLNKIESFIENFYLFIEIDSEQTEFIQI